MESVKLVFVSGKLRDDTYEKEVTNSKMAEEVGIELLKAGYVPIIPMKTFSTHSEYLASLGEDGWVDKFLKPIIRSCVALVTVPNWQESKLSPVEVEFAKSIGIAVVHSVADLVSLYSK